jgi:hypothetical protein
VNLLLSFLATDYHATLTTISRLISCGQITSDILYAILVPRTLFVGRCALTGLERLFELQSFRRVRTADGAEYQLLLEAVDLIDSPMTQSVAVGRVTTTVVFPSFSGSVPITSLNVFPLRFHAAEAQLREAVKLRGRKWVGMIGVHHMQYSGIATWRQKEKDRKEKEVFIRHDVRLLRPPPPILCPVSPSDMLTPWPAGQRPYHDRPQ